MECHSRKHSLREWRFRNCPGRMSAVDDFYPEFGRRVRLARRRAHLSQVTLGRLTGLNRTSITNIEAGRQRIPLHLLLAFATPLDGEPVASLPSSPPAR